MSRFRTIVYTALRIVAALVLMQHGLQKIFGALGGVGPAHGTVPTGSIFWYAGLVESFIVPLVLIGLLARPAALLVSGEMAAAYFLMHAPNGFWPILNHGELPALFSFIFLFFAVFGPGPISVDALLFRGEAARRFGVRPRLLAEE